MPKIRASISTAGASEGLKRQEDFLNFPHWIPRKHSFRCIHRPSSSYHTFSLFQGWACLSVCYGRRGELETSWLVWLGFCFSPQILTSRTLVRIRGAWQRSSHLLPRETRTWLSECCLHADPGFRGGSVGWPSIRVLNLKIQRKKTHTLQPISYLK